MGIGDALMACGEAAALFRKRRQPVVIVDRLNRVQWSDMWEGLPFILKSHQRHSARLRNAPGDRPYILSKTATRWVWRGYEPKPAQIAFTPQELAFAEPYRGAVMLEPNVKQQAHANKAWIWDRWQAVAAELRVRGLRVVQCGAPGGRWLADVERIQTDHIRQACAVLSVASAFAGTEGALHHAAAAVGTDAVIIFGGFISPAVTGYAAHRNLFTGDGLGCGTRTPCSHCAACMERITVEQVLSEALTVLGSSGEQTRHEAA